jgi:zinc resistance-associated protein
MAMPNQNWRYLMKTSLVVAVGVIAFVGSGVAFAAFSGNADPPVRTEKHVFSPADRAAFLDARIAALHAGLTLTPDQEKLWPLVESALRTAAKNAQNEHLNSNDAAEPASLVDRLRQHGERAVARGQSLEAIANAAAPLYVTLSEDQKYRLPVLMHGLRPHFFNHRFAMEGDGHEHWGRADRDEPKGLAPEDGGHSVPNGR